MGVRERMQNGQIYTDLCEGLPEERLHGKELVYDFNHTRPSEEEKRGEILKKLFGHVGNNIWIEPPLHVAYGSRTHIGDNFYANFNLVLVDDIDIFIGNNVMFAPNVTISVTGHPVHPDLRKNGEQFSFPVTIEDNVWVGSNVVILPGVTIGKNSVIGAGSIVTKDIPENVVAVGNPCKVLRPITDRDKEYYYKDLKIDSF
jgi:galactoside O-acetyltransferase